MGSPDENFLKLHQDKSGSSGTLTIPQGMKGLIIAAGCKGHNIQVSGGYTRAFYVATRYGDGYYESSAVNLDLYYFDSTKSAIQAYQPNADAYIIAAFVFN